MLKSNIGEQKLEHEEIVRSDGATSNIIWAQKFWLIRGIYRVEASTLLTECTTSYKGICTKEVPAITKCSKNIVAHWEYFAPKVFILMVMENRIILHQMEPIYLKLQ